MRIETEYHIRHNALTFLTNCASHKNAGTDAVGRSGGGRLKVNKMKRKPFSVNVGSYFLIYFSLFVFQNIFQMYFSTKSMFGSKL